VPGISFAHKAQEILMIGIVQVLKEGYGFITEENTERLWFFSFQDAQEVREGQKVKFQKKNNKEKFEEKLNAGLLKDATINHRNPKFRKTERDGGVSKAPAATCVEIIVEQGAQ
jgi:cold shock CspA family protein